MNIKVFQLSVSSARLRKQILPENLLRLLLQNPHILQNCLYVLKETPAKVQLGCLWLIFSP